MLTALFVLLVTLGFFLFRIHRPRHYAALHKLNGPRLLPVVGMCFDLIGFDSMGVTKYILETDAKFESPIRYKIMSTYIVHVFRASQISNLLRSRTNIRKGDVYRLLHCWLGSSGLLTSHGDTWSVQRKALTPAFHQNLLKQFAGIMQKNANMLVNHISLVISKQNNNDDKQEINLTPLVSLLTLDIICETAMGIQLNSFVQKHSPFATNILEFGELLTYRLLRPWAWNDRIFFNLHPKGRRLQKILTEMQGVTEKLIEDRRVTRQLSQKTKLGTEEPNDEIEPMKTHLGFMDLLLELYEKGQMGLEQVKAQVNTFTFAGHDTTAAALQWVIYTLATHPDVQERCRDEVDTAFADNDMATTDPTSEQLSGLDYLERSIKETLRLYPAVAVFERDTVEPLDLGNGVTIPAGVLVEVWTAMLHRDPEQFPEPNKFDPDRFLPEIAAKRHPLAYIPFSAGPRNCIGQKFAMLELKIVVSSLLRRFRFECHQTIEDLRPYINLTYQPSVPLMLHFQER